MNTPRSNRPFSADRAVFASRLQEAIDRQGLTYEETARRAREHLPSDARLSAVSVWQYANGKTFPRRLSYIEALSRVLDIEPEDLLAKPDTVAGSESADETRAPGRSATQVRVEDLNHGRARLIIDVEVPWPLALRVLALLKVPDEAPPPAED
jgi:transcriptional regulator with XRE-family HTH domain